MKLVDFNIEGRWQVVVISGKICKDCDTDCTCRDAWYNKGDGISIGDNIRTPKFETLSKVSGISRMPWIYYEKVKWWICTYDGWS